ncbi:alpha/beta fold hydrolase [Microbacterium sp. PRC9]|uniref:alpha/beta fold hydrolase n=1 Tax=Microbacterium sp. PRC9 TaxID=2962591 RepID=UPI0028812691|nr:alpha/beta fold hydrolase [Microbacterium sp. PRC9]MDT0144740.1 alpha/beta fold hydrolase [Microbacterium sp. PRC9]
MGTSTRRARRQRFVFAFVAATLAVVGGVVAAEEARLVGDALERPGIDAFYAQPDDAADGEPGSLVKADALLGAPFAARAWRIMYRTTDVHGDPAVATGVLVAPLTPAPSRGRTVVSWGHPTTGAARDCAPSYGFDPFVGIEGLRFLLDRGYAVVATDYVGMGTAGPDSYLVGVTGGNAVLDAVRAARAITDARASERVVLWGHSQGGQAVLFAAQQAADYAPELDIRAVAAAAPAADLPGLMSAHLDDISGVTIGSYAFTAYADVYPEASLDGILTPTAQEIVPRMNQLCLLTNISELHEIGQPLVGDFTMSDPTKTEPWASLLDENSAGATAFDAPLFLAQGLEDELVVPSDTTEFAQHEADLGIDVTYHEIPFANHGTVAYLALPAMLRWLEGVSAG